MLRKDDKIIPQEDKASKTINSTKLINNQLLSDFVSGTAAGSVIAGGFFPFESYKKYVQGGRPGKFVPYKGFGIFAINIIPTTVIQVMTNGYLKSMMSENASISQKLAASFYCGLQGALFATVVENCIMSQYIYNTKMLSTLNAMYKTGWQRPWKSYSMIASRDGIFTAYMLGVGEEIDKYANQNLSYGYSMLLRFGAGFIGTGLSHPFDMVGAKMQQTNRKISPLTAAKEIMAERGYKGFFTGFGSRLVMFNAFGVAIPYIKKHIDEYIDNPNKKATEVSQQLNNYSLAPRLFGTSQSKKEPCSNAIVKELSNRPNSKG